MSHLHPENLSCLRDAPFDRSNRNAEHCADLLVAVVSRTREQKGVPELPWQRGNQFSHPALELGCGELFIVRPRRRRDAIEDVPVLVVEIGLAGQVTKANEATVIL